MKDVRIYLGHIFGERPLKCSTFNILPECPIKLEHHNSCTACLISLPGNLERQLECL